MPLLPDPLKRARSRATARLCANSERPSRAIRRICPNPFSQRERWADYLAERPFLKALQLHLRARGHRAVIERGGILGPAVRDERGNLHMTFGGMEVRAERRKLRRAKGTRGIRPTWPLFTMWQEKRLVLLKKPSRRLTGLRASR